MNKLKDEKRIPGASTIVRGTICHVVKDPFAELDETCALNSYDDGGLVYDGNGRILGLGEFAQIFRQYPQADVIDRQGCLILPGFIDCHIHLSQALMIGSSGEELLDWLARYVRPEEARFSNSEYARSACLIFFEEVISHGTTSAVIFGPHFEEALLLAFQEAERRRFRAIMGLTMEDRDPDAALSLAPGEAYRACKRIIEQWHGRGKMRYVVTPRYALACTPELFKICRQLLDEYGDLYFQTHLNENHKEITEQKEMYPHSTSYLDVYDKFGLLGPRSFFDHSIYSSLNEIDLLAATASRVVHCPSSNMFLGSGLLPLKHYVDRGVPVAMGSDVGAGTGYSTFKEMKNAYQIQSLLMFAMQRPDQAVKLTGAKLLYLATLAGARALRMEGQIGNFVPGACADLTVVDPDFDPYLKTRLQNCSSIEQKIFCLAVLGGKQVIREVLIDGQIAYQGKQAAGTAYASLVTKKSCRP